LFPEAFIADTTRREKANE